MAVHRSFARERGHEGVDLEAAFTVVADRIRQAAVEASRRLSAAGIRHALVGGLAVGAHGRPRTTDDVDFLVDANAFVEHEGGIVTLNAAVPISLGGVAIDVLGAQPDEDHLRGAFARAVVSAGVPVAPVEVVVYLKLRAKRPRDQRDVLDLIEHGLDVKAVRAYLAREAQNLVARFDTLVAEAGG